MSEPLRSIRAMRHFAHVGGMTAALSSRSTWLAPVVMGDSSDGDSLGSPSYATINTFFECKDGVSIGLITVVVLGILTMFYILFTKITQGRRKRDLTGGVSAGWSLMTLISLGRLLQGKDLSG